MPRMYSATARGQIVARRQSGESVTMVVAETEICQAVGGPDQHGQHVGAGGQLRVGTAIRDLGVQQRVRPFEAPANVAPRTALLKLPVVDGQRGPRIQVQHPRHNRPQCGESGRFGGTDDGAQDHLKGDLLC